MKRSMPVKSLVFSLPNMVYMADSLEVAQRNYLIGRKMLVALVEQKKVDRDLYHEGILRLNRAYKDVEKEHEQYSIL